MPARKGGNMTKVCMTKGRYFSSIPAPLVEALDLRGVYFKWEVVDRNEIRLRVVRSESEEAPSEGGEALNKEGQIEAGSYGS